MLSLRFDTGQDWVAKALANLDEILVEQAHLEKKAAAAALNLLFRYPHVLEIQAPLAELAREELSHFTRVLDLLAERGIAFGRVRPSPYAEGLLAAVSAQEPERMLDSMLCCAIIEARSCERMKLLGDAVRARDARLAEFYRELVRCEAGHHALYLELSEKRYPRSRVRARLDELLAHEAEILAREHPLPRLHG